LLVNLSLHFKQLIIIHLLYWNPRCINNNISPKKILRILIQYFISMCVMLNILDEAFFSNFFCPLVNHNLLASFIEISSAAIGVLNYFHSSRVICLFFYSFLEKSEAVIGKKNEEVTCLRYYLHANPVIKSTPCVQIRSSIFFSFLRVRNSKFLGFTRP
jgi:hypothetical protein